MSATDAPELIARVSDGGEAITLSPREVDCADERLSRWITARASIPLEDAR